VLQKPSAWFEMVYTNETGEGFMKFIDMHCDIFMKAVTGGVQDLADV